MAEVKAVMSELVQQALEHKRRKESAEACESGPSLIEALVRCGVEDTEGIVDTCLNFIIAGTCRSSL